MPTITGIVETGPGVTVTGARVIAELVVAVNSKSPGFDAVTSGEVIGIVETVTDTNGVWALDLFENAALLPAGSVYRFVYTATGMDTRTFYRVVGGMDAWIGDLEILGPQESPPFIGGGGTAAPEVVFARSGTVTVTTGANRWYASRHFTIGTVVISAGTAPTGASLVVDVNRNGTTIFTTQANRPTLVAAANSGQSGIPDVTILNTDDYLTVDVDQVGSSIAGSDLTVQILLS